MNNNTKYLIYICNIFLIVLTFYNIFSYNIKENEVNVFTRESSEGKYISYLEIDNTKTVVLESSTPTDEDKIDIKANEDTKIEVEQIKPDDKVEENKETPLVETLKDEPIEKEKKEVVIETVVGNLVGYGPDCHGCTSMKTASGKYVGEGNIYYDDPIYGKIRIVAGDYSYPFGTIVKISNVDFYNDEPFYAIVLDRGGDIGKNKSFLFDLLFASEKDAYALGKEINIKYEIMRLGY